MENIKLNYLDCWTIECSWKNVLHEQLLKTCQPTVIDAGSKSINVDDITSLETCVCLARAQSTGPPDITISSKNLLRRIDIASEAKLVEVFRGKGEYLATCHSDFFDDFDGMAVYYTKVLVPTAESSLTFRFSRMRNQDRLWIYGIRLQLAPAPHIPSSITNSESQSNLLNQPSNIPLSTATLAKRLGEMIEHREVPYSDLSRGSEPSASKCSNCDKHLLALEKRMNDRLTQMEENIVTEIRSQNERLLETIKTLLKFGEDQQN